VARREAVFECRGAEGGPKTSAVGSLFDNLAGSSITRRIRDRAHHRQVMGNEQVSSRSLGAASSASRSRICRPHRTVQRADSFVKEDQVRADNPTHGANGDPLALARSREFMDYLVASSGTGPRRSMHRPMASVRGAALGGWQQVERFGDQPVDTVARVESTERVLNNHLHLAAHINEVGFWWPAIDRSAVEW